MLLLAFTSITSAHGMQIHADITPTVLRVTAAYDDGEPIFPGTVKLFDAAGTEIARVATNEKGIAELPRPKAGEYKLRTDDGGAHAKTIPLTIPDSEIREFSTSDEPANRFLMIAAGLATIAGLSFLLRSFRRRPAESEKSPPHL